MDPTLRNFAVFINSNTSLYKSTQKSRVNIPFNGNLASHDPHKMLRVALSQMKFTNSVYNIDETNNTLIICAEFSKGRGYNDAYAAAYGVNELNRHLWQTWTLRIPVGFYDSTTLANTLSEKGVLYPESQTNPYINRVGYESVQQRFQYDVNDSSYNSCFVGFGANPADPADPIITKGVITIENNSKVTFQSSDLSHMVQYGTDISTTCINILAPGDEPNSTTLDYSMVYRGVHLIYNNLSAGLLKLCGFFNIETIPPQPIDGYCDNTGNQIAQTLGYSLYFSPGTIKVDGTVPPLQNTTFYQFDTTKSNLLAVYPPSFLQDQVTVNGWVVGTALGDLTPELALLDQVNLNTPPDGYYEVALGDFIAGTGITQPSPYFSSLQVSQDFYLTFLVGVNTTVTTPLAAWNAAAGYGIQVGYPIRINDFNDASDALEFPVPFIGYFVTSINTSADPVVLTLDHSYNALVGGTYACSFRNYVLSRSQAVSEVPPLYQLMVVSGDPVSIAAAELRPNTVSNLEGLDEIHVHCPQLRTQHYSSSQMQALAPSDVIAVVPVDVVFGSKQTFNPPVVLDAFLNNTNITNLEFILTDSNNKQIDFNGVDWSMVLKCEEVDVDTTAQLNQQGLFNTPFQDQLQLLEGTARQEIRAKRGRLPYEFFDPIKNRKT